MYQPKADEVKCGSCGEWESQCICITDESQTNEENENDRSESTSGVPRERTEREAR